MIDVELKILDPRLGGAIPLPEAATAGSAGMDLRAAIESPLTLAPGESALVPSGIALHIGYPIWCAQKKPHTKQNHKHNQKKGNLVGVIDADYQGPLMISCWNRGSAAYTIGVGDRIAQLLLVPVAQARLRVVNEFAPSGRGAGGFGSTGIK